jgi:hypothetical protein
VNRRRDEMARDTHKNDIAVMRVSAPVMIMSLKKGKNDISVRY